MARYVLVLKQAGEGCDYTIGCGTHDAPLVATERAAAADEAAQLLEQRYLGDGGDTGVDVAAAYVAEVVADLPVAAMRDARRRAAAAAEQAEREAEERRQLAALKAKYEGAGG